MEELAKKQCVDGAALLDAPGTTERLARMAPGWQVEDHRLIKTYTFADFLTALDFVNRAAAIAESIRHHPDLHLSWGKVRVETWTHTAGGLTDNDFILAARLELASR